MAIDASCIVCRSFLVLVAMMFATSATRAQEYYRQFDDYDLAMNDRPSLEWDFDYKMQFVDGLKELWQRALERPDPELQRLVIDTLAIAKNRDIDGIVDLQPRLVEMAKVPDQRIDLLRAIAQTLVVFDAKDQASLLAGLSEKYGAPLGQIVEPALTAWGQTNLREAWLQRVRQQSDGASMMTLAIEGLVALDEENANDPLESIVRNIGQTVQVRLSAARALGQLNSSGLVELARDLVEQDSRPAQIHPILAVQLLLRHEGSETVALLTEISQSENTLVQSEALGQLYRLDPAAVDRQRDRLVESPDVNVRRWCLKAMADAKEANRIPLIASLLDDVNPGLRRGAASALVELAQSDQLRDVVIRDTEKMLNEQQDWRGLEQACVVMAKLDHEPSGPRLVELLGNDRGEVQVAAAWGLSKLRVAELLPDMLEHAQSVYDGFQSGVLRDGMPGKAMHLAHLFIAFGDQDYRPAEELIRAYLPENHELGVESRAAAAWAIGLFYEDDLQDDLAKLLSARLRDNGMDPDTDEMRQMCAITLGRMKAEQSLKDLRQYASDEGMPHCFWAIEQITGETPPKPADIIVPVDDWFLTPVEDKREMR